MWFQANNPFYADVAIDYESLQRLPEDGVPDDLPTVEDPESNEQQDAQQEDAENQRQQTEQDAIRALINGVDPLNWAANDGHPINEFRTEGLASMAFPTLFPYGKGDPTKRTRLREVSLTDGFKHLIKYADLSTDGIFTWPFASHPRFPYFHIKHETAPSIIVTSSHLPYSESRRCQLNDQGTSTNGRSNDCKPPHESSPALRC